MLPAAFAGSGLTVVAFRPHSVEPSGHGFLYGYEVDTVDEAGASDTVLTFIDTDVSTADATSVLGQTKRLSERLTAWYAARSGLPYLSVRFGNVLGSRGSVLDTFRAQIKRGGPVTVTHPEVTRFFMTIPEACELVLQAGAIGKPGDVLVLDMGEPVRIVDLARQLIQLAGLRRSDIAIEFSGLRPGEKLYEELLADDDTTLPTVHARLRIARLKDDAASALVEALDAGLPTLPVGAGEEAVKAWLKEVVPEYSTI